MGRLDYCRVWVGLVLVGFLAKPLEASPGAVAHALDQQEAWLSTSDQHAAWQSFLETETLRQLLSETQSPDRRMVAKVLGRYSSGVPGLEHPRFQATRVQLQGWADELKVPLALRWAEQARAQKVTPCPTVETWIPQAKAELVEAMTRLERELDRTSLDNARAWKDYLLWDDLKGQIRAETLDPNRLEKVANQFFQGHRGLELPEFVAVREALRRTMFLEQVRLQTPEGRQKLLASQLELLAHAMETYNDKPGAKSAGMATTLAHWIDQLGCLPGLAQELRRYHHHPNVIVHVSEEFISRRFANVIQESRPVDEMILGTHVRGTAHTTAQLSADVVPQSGGARIDVLMHGTTQTQSVGRQTPVTIHSRSRTSIDARKPLLISPYSLSSSSADANCSTHTDIFSIVPDGRFARRLIERVAWKKSAAQKPQAEQIASHRAEKRIESQMDERSEQLLTQARQTLRDRMRGPFDRRGLIPQQLEASSTDTYVTVTGVQANTAQAAAPTHPPQGFQGHAVGAWIHESAINNTAEQAIAGLRISDARAAEIMKDLTGKVPEELLPGEDKNPWSIAFDWQHPVTVEFDDQQMNVAVRGREFTSGDNVLKKVMEISARYLMQTSPQGVILTRQGDVEVNFPNQQDENRLSNQEVFFRTLMRKKFAGLFKEVIQGEGVVLPGRWQTLGKLRLQNLQTQDGWLSLGWQ